MTVFELTSVVGLFAGPVISALLAVWLTDRGQRRSAVIARKLDIFRTLMRNRRAQLDPSFVGALNLIEVDFHDEHEVQARFKELINSFSGSVNRMQSEEVISSDSPVTVSSKNDAYGRRVYDGRQELVARLLFSMAISLGYKMEQLDVLKGGYLPQKFTDIEQEQEIIRRFVIELARGKQTLPVALTTLPTSSPVL